MMFVRSLLYLYLLPFHSIVLSIAWDSA